MVSSDLVCCLLVARRGQTSLRPLLQDIDWDALIEKRLDAPWTPNVKDAKDLGNFTDEYPDSDTEDVPYTGDPSWYADF